MRPGDAARPDVVVTTVGAEPGPAEVHGPGDVTKPLTSRDLHVAVRARIAKAARKVRPTPDGALKRRRRGGRPRTPNGPAAKDGRKRG